MKSSDRFIALSYWISSTSPIIWLAFVLLLGFTAQIRADADSFNTLSGTHGGKNNSTDLLISEEKAGLTLRDAVNLALLRSPELAAFAKEMRALEGATLQAGLLKNPEIFMITENVGNIQKPPIKSDPLAEEVAQQVTTIRLSQLIELGGKRIARVNAALLGEELAAKDYEARRVEMIARVANTFIEVLAAQERLRLAEETRQVAQNVVNTVTGRVQAGKVPPIEETRVKISLSTTRVELEQAQRELIAARKRLALLWNSSSPQFDKALGNLETLIAPPGYQVLEARILDNPMALRALKAIEHRKMLVEVEQTRRIPNLTLIAGVDHHAQVGGTTPVAGLSVPLPLFDRNQGNLKEANQRVDKAMDEQVATELRLKTELAQSYETMSAVWNEINILRDEILPGAKDTFHVMRRGYELGKFGLLELLDAQRVLFHNQLLYVRALANYQRLVNDIERLIAAPIDSILPDRGGEKKVKDQR